MMQHSATLHPAVRTVIAKFQALELHAARSGREVIIALAEVAADSVAEDASALAAEIERSMDAILDVMPPYAPPLNVMHRLSAIMDDALARGDSAGEAKRRLQDAAADYHHWSVEARQCIAVYGANLIPDGATVFTYTLSETALRTLRHAWRTGRHYRLLLTESRPNNDGQVTATELSSEGVPVSLSIDACVAALVRQADLMIVGAESILADGSAICKVGTYPAALAARAFGVPVYVAVDTMKFNVTSLYGIPHRLDPLRASDLGAIAEGPTTRVVGHLFDQTPAALITGIITERGILSPAACSALMTTMPVSARLCDRLAGKYATPQ